MEFAEFRLPGSVGAPFGSSAIDSLFGAKHSLFDGTNFPVL
ncbi:MAG TPA: hypothetical protein VEU53_09885 [Stellaceae bacterium]|nr:hypothetical protein [Stellaceae bacterium]